MANILTQLKAVLTLNSKDFEKNLKKSGQDTKAFGKGVEKVGVAIAAAFSTRAIINFSKELAQTSSKLVNVGRAFERLGDPYLLDRLVRATGGMVDNLKLMEQAVKAVNLGIRQDDLAKYFEFATIRAAETGESVDYLVESIVTGIGRKSIMILDNLGISAIDIQTEFKKTGDFATAAGNLIDIAMGKSDVSVGDVADQVTQLNANWNNFIQNLAKDQGPFINAILEKLAGATRVATEPLTMYGEDGVINREYFQSLEDAEKALASFVKQYDDQMSVLTTMGDLAGKEFSVTMEEWEIKQLRAYNQATANADILRENISLLKQQIAVLKERNKVDPLEVSGAGTSKTGMGPTPGGLASITAGIGLETGLEYINMLSEMGIKAAGVSLAFAEMAINMEGVTTVMKKQIDVSALVAAGIGSIAEAAGELAAGEDSTEVMEKFLKNLGGLMKSFGMALITIGLGKIALNSFSAPLMIAGGAAIIAAGALISSSAGGMKNLAGGGTGGYGSTGGGTYQGGSFDYSREVVFVARGKDLVATLDRQRNSDYTMGNNP